MKNMSWRNILKDEAVENRHYERLKELGEDVGVEQARDIFGLFSSNIIEDVDKILYDILDEQVKEIKDKSKDFEKQWDSATAKIPGVKGNVGGKFISEIYEQTLMNSMNYFINKRRSDVYYGIFNVIKSNTAIPLVNDFDNETFKRNVRLSPVDYFSTLILKPASDDDRGLGNLFDTMEIDSSSWDSTRSIFRSRLLKIIDKNTANHKMKIFEPSARGPSDRALLPNLRTIMDRLPKKTRDRNILYAKVPIDGGPPATFKISLEQFLVMLINVNNNEIVQTYRLFLSLVSRVNEKLKSFWGVDKDYMRSGGRDKEYEEANTFAGISPEELGEGIERTLVSGVVRAQKNINDTVKNLKQIEVVDESSAKYDKRLYTYGELGATPPEGKTAKDIVETFTDRTKKLTQQEIKQRDDVGLTGLNIMQGDKKIGTLLYKIVIPVVRAENLSEFLSSKERQLIDNSVPAFNSSQYSLSRPGRVMPIIFIGALADIHSRNIIDSYIEAPSIKTIARIFTEPESYNYPTPSELVATGFASDTVTDFLPSVTSSEFARLVYHEPSERNFIEYKFTVPLIEFGDAEISYISLENALENSDEDGLISFKNYLIQNNLLKQENAFRITEDMAVDFLRLYRATIRYLSDVSSIYRSIKHFLGWQYRMSESTENLYRIGKDYNIDITRLLALSGLTVKKFESKIFLDVFGAMRSRGEKGQRTRSSQYGDYTVSLGQPHLCFYSKLRSGKIYPETGGGDVCIVLSSNVPVADAVGPISLQLLQLVNILEDFSKEFNIRKFSQLTPVGIESDLAAKFADIISNSEVKPVGEVKVV